MPAAEAGDLRRKRGKHCEGDLEEVAEEHRGGDRAER